jgi:hypothetical protein
MKAKTTLQQSLAGLVLMALTLVLQSPAMAADKLSLDEAREKQAYAFGVQAYIWGYPMVVMNKSMSAMTSSDHSVTPEEFKKTGKIVGPVNQVSNAWQMLGPNFSAVQSVNSDTLYEIIWADSSEEPYVLHIPDTKGRYYTFQFIDAWTNNYFYASTRTMGSQDQEYAIVAPGWDGELPKGVIRVESPTPTHFIIGRIYVADEKDTAAVNELQKQVTMTPLSQYGKNYTPPKVPVVPAKKYTGDLAFFEQLGDTLVINGALSSDAGILGFFKEIGLTTDRGFDPSGLSEGEKKALARAVVDGNVMLAAKADSLGRKFNGWAYADVLDEFYGTDYMTRAAIGYQAMFENTPIEAYYPSIYVDMKGKNLDASSGNYTMTFSKGGLPPVGAFWSTSLYYLDTRLLVKNSLNRYKISSADTLKTNADGSTTIYLQTKSPGKDKESNWLPTPNAPFYMLFRMYQPDIEALNGQYNLPGLVKAK